MSKMCTGPNLYMFAWTLAILDLIVFFSVFFSFWAEAKEEAFDDDNDTVWSQKPLCRATDGGCHRGDTEGKEGLSEKMEAKLQVCLEYENDYIVMIMVTAVGTEWLYSQCCITQYTYVCLVMFASSNRQPFKFLPQSLILQETFTSDLHQKVYTLESKVLVHGNKKAIHILTLGFQPQQPYVSQKSTHGVVIVFIGCTTVLL